MTNRLLSDWHLKIKYVDDTSAVEILLRNFISYLNTVVSDILQFSTEHGMKLNPLKCKEMLINFMINSNFITAPINIGNRIVDPVTSYKILGVIIDNDLRWNSHVDNICKKASKRLYSLRLLKSAGVEKRNILRVYTTTIRPILEYAAPVWQAILPNLSDKIESIQKRALHIIDPEPVNYDEALTSMQLETLSKRRHSICVQYMAKIKSENHPLNMILPQCHTRNISYNLRSKQDQIYYRDQAEGLGHGHKMQLLCFFSMSHLN